MPSLGAVAWRRSEADTGCGGCWSCHEEAARPYSLEETGEAQPGRRDTANQWTGAGIPPPPAVTAVHNSDRRKSHHMSISDVTTDPKTLHEATLDPIETGE